MRTRRGFTLVELLVVAVVGVLLVLATYQVLVVNQRTYTVQNEHVRAQQSTRAAMDVLFNELREVSSRGGDILSFSEDSLTVHVMRTFGVTCDPDWTTTPTLRVRPAGADSFVVGDSVFVYADNEEAKSSDDAWISAVVSAADNSVTCSNGDAAQDLTFAGYNADFTNDSVRMGAPIRAYGTYTYGLYEENGQAYLGRKAPGQDAVPLVGPLVSYDSSTPGLVFSYFDENGATATVATDVREIRVTVRARSEAKNPTSGRQVADSLTAAIYTRN